MKWQRFTSFILQNGLKRVDAVNDKINDNLMEEIIKLYERVDGSMVTEELL